MYVEQQFGKVQVFLSFSSRRSLPRLFFSEAIEKEIELNYTVMGRLRATLSGAEEIKPLKKILTFHYRFLSKLL